MSTTSANPERLDQFVSRTQTLHRDAGAERQSLAGFAAGVRARSADFGVDSPSIAAVASLLAGMESNDLFVTTISDELLAADGASVDGRRTIADARLVGALDRARRWPGARPGRVRSGHDVGLPPTSGFVDDPICAANGNMIHQDVDLQFPGIAAALEIRRTYNSLLSRRRGAFGVGSSSISTFASRPDPAASRSRSPTERAQHSCTHRPDG